MLKEYFLLLFLIMSARTGQKRSIKEVRDKSKARSETISRALSENPDTLKLEKYFGNSKFDVENYKPNFFTIQKMDLESGKFILEPGMLLCCHEKCESKRFGDRVSKFVFDEG